jgi:hypothetical protein
MSQRAIILTVVLFVIIIVGMFGFAYMKKQEVEQPVNQVNEELKEEVKYASVTRIDAKHFYIDGVHTLVGEIPMPTPCDLLNTDVLVAESYPEQVRIDFTVINNAETCAQVVTPARFKVEATASSTAEFSAYFQGRPVELNLIPAAEGETPDDFEVFIKG